jgi:hypothetical protein
MAKTARDNFFKTRTGLFLTGLVSFVGVWLVFLRASDTGSLQQYGILILLLIFGINRTFSALFFKKHE